MKPVSYQSRSSSVNDGHKNLSLDQLLSTSKILYCEKCGFASRDSEVFRKHVMEHMGTRFYCFYCNNVSFSEAELNIHLKQHTAKYPFRCQHCGQGYMRKMCLVKHIERLHGKFNGQELTKPAITKSAHVPVSNSLTNVPSADPVSVWPAVKVTVPTPITPAARLGKEQDRGKTQDINGPKAKGNVELMSPLNGLTQHNRALTVSLPEEVSIPAGCLVELIEMRTVNGTKELKLRLVSQQEDESVIKETRTAVSQNTALGKPLSSALNNPNTPKSTNMGMCTVNRKQCESKTPAGVPVNISTNPPNQASIEKFRTKRTQEITKSNLECHTVIPAKVSKQILNPVREGNYGFRINQRETANHNAVPPISTKIANRLTNTLNPENTGKCLPQRTVDGRMNFVPEHSQSVPLRRGSEMKSTPQDVSVSIKQEPGVIDIKGNLASRIRKEAVGLNQQSVKSASSSTVPLAAAIQGSSSVYVCNDAAPADPSFPIPVTAWRILNEPSSTRQLLVEGGSTLTHSTTSAWTQEVQSNNRTVEQALPEPEHFPVISSVFSLSQQPEDAQGSIQPLVMALRGIVMSKTNSSEKLSPAHISLEPKEEKPASGYCAEAVTKDGPLIHDQLLTEQTSESVKIEEPDKTFQHTDTTENCTNIKEESTSTPPMDNNMCSQTPASSSSTVHQEAVCQISSHRDVSVTADPRLQTPIVLKNEHDVSSRVLTVSLKRIQVGTWKRSKKRLKLRISKCKTQVPMGSLTDCAIIHPTPLKVDQLVKRPGPNQPVVVLNHPKPQVPKGGARATTSVEDTESSEVVPKCQILKMRLSKVMGQKYEVMGCTVRVFP